MLILLAGPVLLGGVGSWLGARFAFLFFGPEEDQSVEELRAFAVELMLENGALREEAMKAARYRTLLGMTRTLPQEAVAGRVLYRTEGLVEGTLVIDRGSRDGVVPGAVCITAEGLVGVVEEVAEATCEVLPITSPGMRVSCMTYPSGAVGILQPGPGRTLQLVDVDLSSSVAPGDEVVTSRYGGVFRDGLLVGTVSESLTGRAGLALEFSVTPAVDFTRISEVLILLEPPPETE
ncbi:rod shape-determining protein MreC [Candidatus Fermentibacteria bacterium]|nr:rod shape-determining protein MreC [Candidatus Fermentibacteria bacterium]